MQITRIFVTFFLLVSTLFLVYGNKAQAAQDVMVPKLTDFSVSSNTIDTSSESVDVTVTFSFTDDLSGVMEDRARVIVLYPDEKFDYFYATKVGGSVLNSTFEAILTIPQYISSGLIRFQVGISDQAGNNDRVYDDEIDMLFGEGTASIVNLATIQDVTPPELTSFFITADIINTDTANQQVTVTFSATDDLSGICASNDSDCENDETRVCFDSDNASYDLNCIYPKRVSGDALDGMYEGTFIFPQYLTGGTWYADIDIKDKAENEAEIDPNEQLGGSVGLITNTTSISDTKEPELVDFTFTPSIINTSNGDAQVRTIARIVDNLAGLCPSNDPDCSDVIVCFYSVKSNDQFRSQEWCGYGMRTSGTKTDGYYEAEVVFPQYTMKGDWKIWIGIEDVFSQDQDYEMRDLETLGFSTMLSNITRSNTVYRFWSDKFQGHFYTISQSERDGIINNDPHWKYEGEAYSSIDKSMINARSVYRFWSENFKHHFYTISESEKNSLINSDSNWSYEGIAYYAYASEQTDTKPVYRFWSDEKKGHFYTSNQGEKEYIENTYLESIWRYEGVAWWVNG